MPAAPWDRDQLLKVLSLYCQLPFGRMHARNPAVIALADALGRTPSAVALKLSNFASLDPELAARGVGGMRNTSAGDRAMWAEYYGNWEKLADTSTIPEDMLLSKGKKPVRDEPSGSTEVLGQSKQRRGQSFFRASVLAAYDGTCCVTGIACLPLLRASHIVPWSEKQELRLNPHNGLCLNALHDAAFDRGLITLTEGFELQVSPRLRSQVPQTVYEEMFECRDGVPIALPERFRPDPEAMEFHRRRIFVA